MALSAGYLVSAWSSAAAIGAAQGVLVAYWRIPSFIVTLGGMLIFRGLTGNLLLGQFVGPFARGFQNIASGFIPDIDFDAGPDIGEREDSSRWRSASSARSACSALSLRSWLRARAEKMEAEPLRAADRQEPHIRGDHHRRRLQAGAL